MRDMTHSYLDEYWVPRDPTSLRVGSYVSDRGKALLFVEDMIGDSTGASITVHFRAVSVPFTQIIVKYTWDRDYFCWLWEVLPDNPERRENLWVT